MINNLFFSEYYSVIIFIVVGTLLSIVIFIASFILSNQAADTEKLSSYECGFDAFEDARNQFDIRFYLVAILFIIFDLEAIYIFPWASSLSSLGTSGFWVMVDFLVELLVGFIYAWKIGALEWE
jgi:NADH-quinone oxidoreductase subunit A